jgi:hypothetical protein
MGLREGGETHSSVSSPYAAEASKVFKEQALTASLDKWQRHRPIGKNNSPSRHHLDELESCREFGSGPKLNTDIARVMSRRNDEPATARGNINDRAPAQH